MPSDSRLLLGLLAGVAAVVDLGLIYFVLARGPVVLIAPIAAGGAAIPAIYGLLQGDPASPAIVAGLLLALAGSFAASLEGEDGEECEGWGLSLLAAFGAAVGIGAALILLERASEADPLWATGFLRVGGLASAAALLGIVVLAQRHRRRSAAAARPLGPDPHSGNPGIASAAPGASGGSPHSANPEEGPAAQTRLRALPLGVLGAMAAVGVLDVSADIGYSNATTIGDLSTIVVLASLYPVVTVILGYFVLHERVRAVQVAGVGLALTGVALLAGAS